MSTKEKAVRDAAVALHKAISDAKSAGLAVLWPSSPEGLAGIAISETGEVKADEPKKQPASKK